MQKMYEDCIRIASSISADPMLSVYPPISVNGKLRDDEIFNIAMLINDFICNATPKIGKCISLPSKYKINKIDMEKGILNVTDKRGNVFTDCSLLHFSTRKANEEGLYLWQKLITDCLYKNKRSISAKILKNSLFKYLFCFFRYTKTRAKYLINIITRNNK